jgi:hypothetical protein
MDEYVITKPMQLMHAVTSLAKHNTNENLKRQTNGTTTVSIMTLSIMAFSIMIHRIMTFSIMTLIIKG